MFDPKNFVTSNLETVEVPDALLKKLGIPRIVERKGDSSSVYRFPFKHNGKEFMIPLRASSVEINADTVILYGNPWTISYQKSTAKEEIVKAFLEQ